MSYKKLNTYLGWLVFLISTAVYFITIEDTVSLWDCGEYITAAYKLEVGHPPGAPLFMLLGRLFTFFVSDAHDVAIWINRMSALSSSFTILFMFWSITLLAKKIAFKESRELTKSKIIAILGSGAIGALAYTFTDSFWFSAVEGEVYAMSSLFTAIIFWAILKWDEEMDENKFNNVDKTNNTSLRWMILIMFLFGLAIGVHLLGLLVVPAIAYVIYFNRWTNFSWKGFFLTGILSIFILGFIQEGIIPGTISLASSFEVNLVNGMGLPFYFGSVFFFALLIGVCIYLLRWSKKKGKPVYNAVVLGFIVFLLGYGSFATIVIRSNANTPLDENDPENLVTLYAYLKREQYGSWPLVSGPYWNSNMDENQENWGNRSPFYARRFVVMKGDKELKGFRKEKTAKEYIKSLGSGHYDVVEKYFLTNEGSYEHQEPAYIQTTIFPRMYWSQDPPKIEKYKEWSGYSENGETTDDPDLKGTDGKRIPTFGENMRYFAHYQVNWMYWRYFMWNFAGRQNDIQGHGDQMRGNWLSGISAIDNKRLGDQDNAPTFTTENPSNNKFYFLPLILGIIGMVFHFYRAPKDAFVVLLTFFFTGLAIVLYLNQKPFEPRERDYAYAASFYAFAMWIGLSVYALYEAFKALSKKEIRGAFYVVAGGLLVALLGDLIFAGDLAGAITWIIISIMGLALWFGMHFVGKSLKNENSGAILSIVVTAIVPFILAFQGWDDHDRSNKTTANDLAYNYLESCTKNSILFTNGDNDTFPLWYLQEVEEKRTDVRVCNLSLMQTDWYTEQMMMKAYESDPLPIKFREDQIMMYHGNTDQVFLFGTFELKNFGIKPEVLNALTEKKIKANPTEFKNSFEMFQRGCQAVAQTLKVKNATYTARLAELQTSFNTVNPNPGVNDVNLLVDNCIEVMTAYSQQNIDGDLEALKQLEQNLKSWDASWDYLPLKDAMDFVRDDSNQVTYEGRTLRVIPTKGFLLPVNKANVLKSKLVAQKDAAKILDVVKFRIDKQGITREQVMMLDIMANNDWKRNIYFSSPYGSDVSTALFYAQAVKQNGMVFELTPLKDQNILTNEKMFNNMMNVYRYGQMDKPGVLTDYYARRHTSQYRDHFSRLAEVLLRDAENEIRQKEVYEPQIKSLRASGNVRLADSLANIIKGADERIAKNKEMAIKLVKKSVSVMPVDRVIDYGEPQGGREDYEVGPGESYASYSDGVLHDYVGLLFRAGAKGDAEKLGMEVARHLESTFNYFEKSAANFSLRGNTGDLVSALDNYMVIAMFASDKEVGNPGGKLSQRTQKMIDHLYKTVFPKLYSDLKAEGKDDEAKRLKAHLDAVGMKYQFIERPVMKMPQGGKDGMPALSPEQIQQMMKLQQQAQ